MPWPYEAPVSDPASEAVTTWQGSVVVGVVVGWLLGVCWLLDVAETGVGVLVPAVGEEPQAAPKIIAGTINAKLILRNMTVVSFLVD
jgi:hypothetical protein